MHFIMEPQLRGRKLVELIGKKLIHKYNCLIKQDAQTSLFLSLASKSILTLAHRIVTLRTLWLNSETNTWSCKLDSIRNFMIVSYLSRLYYAVVGLKRCDFFPQNTLFFHVGNGTCLQQCVIASNQAQVWSQLPLSVLPSQVFAAYDNVYLSVFT